MPSFTKHKSNLHLLLTNSNQATAHGGQVLVDALCRRFGLWKRIHQTPSLDPRKRTGAGFSPVANAAQLLFTLTSGGASLADAARLGQDRVLMHLLGLDKGADQTTLGQWLRAQTKESVMDLHRLNAEFVDWASQQAKPGRWLHAGEAEVFFDDTEIEVEGHKFEGARVNYEGNRALSWQTLWYGPWLLDGILDGASDVSEHWECCSRSISRAGRSAPATFTPTAVPARASLSTASSKPVSPAGVSATTSGPTSWTGSRRRCPRARGARCPQPTNGRSNMGGSNTSPENASRRSALRWPAGRMTGI